MLNRRDLLIRSAGAATALAFCSNSLAAAVSRFPVQLSEAEWRRRLGPAAFAVLRRKGTEAAGSSPLDKEKRRGTFSCAGCANPLFSSRTKFDSGTGWPSFYAALGGAVGTSVERTLGFARVEVHCVRCGGHLGHVFDDGPRPTGKRYCMNGVALRFSAG